MTMEHVSELCCTTCGASYDTDSIHYTCEEHENPFDGLLDVRYDYDLVLERFDEALDGHVDSMWKYRSFLPVHDDAEPVTLDEGGTELFDAPRLSEELGVSVGVKDDSRNPTASFKDRASSLSVTKAKRYGHDIVVCASTGNAAASLAGYAARGGLDGRIFVPASAPAGKLAQPLVYGADVLQVNGRYDEAYGLSLEVTEKYGWYNRNAGFNPYQIEAKRTAGYEIAEQTLDHPPDWVVLSVGDGDSIAGVWKGLREFAELGLIDDAPRMLCVQAEGVSVIHDAFHDSNPGEVASTLADSIAVVKPSSLRKAVAAIEESGGDSVLVSDREILDAEALLGRTEGLYAEPAAAATVAGAERALERGIIDRDETVVVVSSGYGLKDTESATLAGEEPYEIEPRIEEVEAIYGGTERSSPDHD